MNSIKKHDQINLGPRSAVAVAVMVAASSVSAVEIDVGNPDIRPRQRHHEQPELRRI